MPLAVSATTRSGRIASTSTNDRTCSTNAGSRSRSDRVPARGASAGPWPSSTVLATALISPSPSTATGRAPSRQNLAPLYSAGLCEAVNTTPGRSRCPAAKYTVSDDARPMSMTSTPWLSTPSVNAATSAGPVGRMSRPTTISPAAA